MSLIDKINANIPEFTPSPSLIQSLPLNVLSSLNSSANEFTPFKLLNPLADDFKPEPFKSELAKSGIFIPEPYKPEPPKANLKADAPVFVLGSEPKKISEFIPEQYPDEKLDEPLFLILNRELTDEDLHLEAITEIVKVDVKNVYDFEEILNIYKDIRQHPDFEKVSEEIRAFESRTLTTYRIKGHNKKNKESLKANKDWRENEDVEIVSTTVWRKPKTEEEEKIVQKAKRYKTKLTGTKEEHEKIKRTIKSTLNKLSPSNLDKLKEQLLGIGKESVNNLIFLVQCIFEKAWSEVKYTQMYASLCKFLKEKFEMHSFPGLEVDPKKNLFKYELLERCENSFTQTPSEEFTGLSIEETEAKRSQIKKKTLGNVRFIGELFKVELITSKVILNCVNELINTEPFDEDKIEGACILLSTGGSSFERSKLIGETDNIFKILESIIKSESLTSKNRFKLMDVIDERKNNWKRLFKEEVKTVKEIHEEFELELQKKRRY